MRAAIVEEAGKTPIYGDFKEPEAAAGEVCVTVATAALSPVVRSRASGKHYSSSGNFPFVVGVDGAGRLDDGRRVYFVLPKAPFGSMSERTVVPLSNCIALPDALDDIKAAAIGNPGLSSWAAFRERAKLSAGETVLVNGSTGTAGRLAVQIAKHMGAKRVIATGRNAETLQSLEAIGADVTIPLGDAGSEFEDALREQFDGEGIDVVLDYLWGESAERIIVAGAKAGKGTVPIRFVHIGSASAPNITLPGAALRSSALELMGSGIGSIAMERLVNLVDELLQATAIKGFEIATNAYPLSEVESVWVTPESAPRAVFQVA